MTDAANGLVAALKSGDAGKLAGLLAEDAGFQALNVDLKGRCAVLKRLADNATSYRDAKWGDVKQDGAIVRAHAVLPNGSPMILSIHAKGDRIALLQQQQPPPTPRPATAIKLPQDVKDRITNALQQRHSILISYVDETGQPVLTFRGSTQAYSDDQLAIWIRNTGGKFIKSIAKNPKVALMYRDEDAKATYSFVGRAWVDNSEAARDKVYATMAKIEKDHDFAHSGVAVIIDLDRVEGYAGLGPSGPVNPIRMERGAA
jgi:general stress protein 26